MTCAPWTNKQINKKIPFPLSATFSVFAIVKLIQNKQHVIFFLFPGIQTTDLSVISPQGLLYYYLLLSWTTRRGRKKKKEFFLFCFLNKKKKVKMLQRQFISWENFVGRSYLLIGMCQGCGDGAGCSQATVIILKLQHFLVLCGPLVLSSTAYK